MNMHSFRTEVLCWETFETSMRL